MRMFGTRRAKLLHGAGGGKLIGISKIDHRPKIQGMPLALFS